MHVLKSSRLTKGPPSFIVPVVFTNTVSFPSMIIRSVLSRFQTHVHTRSGALSPVSLQKQRSAAASKSTGDRKHFN